MITPSDPAPLTAPRLSIELIPESSWQINVRSLVSRKTWDILRARVYETAAHRCEICRGQGGGRVKVACHEVWAFEENVQRLVRLICLCPACHEVKHFGYARVRGREAEARAHLERVNGWSEADAQFHISQQFELWKSRSKIPWKVDISILQEQEQTWNG